MALTYLLYAAMLMIFYDLSAHLIYLLGIERLFLRNKLNWWPEWGGKKYAAFWTIYWGVAFVLLLTYILTA